MSKTSSLVFLVISQVAAFAALIPWFYLFAFALAFKPEDGVPVSPYLAAAGLALYPLVLLYTTIRSWMLFKKQAYNSATWLMAWIGVPALFFMGWLLWIQ